MKNVVKRKKIEACSSLRRQSVESSQVIKSAFKIINRRFQRCKAHFPEVKFFLEVFCFFVFLVFGVFQILGQFDMSLKSVSSWSQSPHSLQKHHACDCCLQRPGTRRETKSETVQSKPGFFRRPRWRHPHQTQKIPVFS